MSNLEWFKYEWIWYKNNPTGFYYAKKQPMRATENIVIFYDHFNTYNPQMMKSRITDRRIKDGMKNGNEGNSKLYQTKTNCHPLNKNIYPWNVLEFKVQSRSKGTLHPTQKPVALYEYLIRTYTNEGDTVLDIAMGSGTTGVACIQTGRKFIGIEIDETYFNIAKDRIAEAQLQMRMPI